LQQSADEWFHVEIAQGDLSDEQVEQQVALMLQARKDKNYALADEIRDNLLNQGISLTRDGWKRG
jgi:cysteinyl-tRNA synthetase